LNIIKYKTLIYHVSSTRNISILRPLNEIAIS